MRTEQIISHKIGPSPCTLRRQSGNILLYILLFSLLLLCYYNSFQASWHFDDIANIVLNTPLHIDDLSPASLKQTFFAYPDLPGKLLRPVTNLTFGLNWFFHQDRVFGYHAVNFLIHFFTTIFLYHSCLLLLRTPLLNNKYQDSRFFIAACTAILWAVNPVQTQAITYIVQRTASLATLFFISGIWCYLKARILAPGNRRSVIFYICTGLCFFLAIGSKENTVVFPAAIILIEWFFFQQTIRWNKQNAIFSITGLAFILAGTLFLVGPKFFLIIFNAYEDRDFTIWQRLFTEARIVIFYITLLLYPSPSRLSITHDVTFSSSLLSPFTTLPAMLLLALLTMLPFIFHKRYPLISFAILFFLLNHVVESTVIPLEILFEHRNYLPSLFLFLPLAAGIGTVLQKYKSYSQVLYIAAGVGTTSLIILLAIGTIARNTVWLTERSLWEDSLEKAPLSARSYINLAHSYLYQDKNYQKAFQLCSLSLDKQSPTPWKDRLRANNIMGHIMTQIGNYQQALIFYNKALAWSKTEPHGSLYSETLFYKAKTQWLSGQAAPAMRAMAKLVNANPDTPHFLQFYGEILVASEKKSKGVTMLARALTHSDRNNKEYRTILLDLSIGYSQMKNYPKATFFYKVAKLNNSAFIPTNLCLLENSIRVNKSETAEYALRSLLTRLTWPRLLALLEGNSDEHPPTPFDYSLLQAYASDWLALLEKS